MNRNAIQDSHFTGVIAVPPLPRRSDRNRAPDFAEARRLLDHVAGAGITRFMFGGNAFFFHVSLREYRDALTWMTGLPDEWWILPSAGPGFGRLRDQAEVLRPLGFPAVMLLPCSDPRDAVGLERGIREFTDGAATPVILYLKQEDTFGADRTAGIEAIGRLMDDGVCVGIKYAVVRSHPTDDSYLAALLGRVARARVASGIGERPAVVHLRDWKLPGFTTGSGCVAPGWTARLYDRLRAGRWDEAESIRERFLPLEDCRDAWNPARVLHHAVALAGVAETGPILPFLSELNDDQVRQVRTALMPLLEPVG